MKKSEIEKIIKKLNKLQDEIYWDDKEILLVDKDDKDYKKEEIKEMNRQFKLGLRL